MPLPDLHHGTGEWRGRRQAIQHPIVGQVAIPTDFALFGGKAFPGKRLGQGRKRFLLSALAGAFMGRAMHAGIDAFAPGCRLATLVLDIGEGDAWPEILFDKADRALDFPFRLWGKGLTDAWRDPNGGHEEGLAGVPAGRLVFHCQQHALHAVGQGSFWQSPKVFKGLHQAADQRPHITAFDKGDKAHARVAEDGTEAVELARHAVLLILELAPVKLHLLTGLGFIPNDGSAAASRRTQGMHKGFEHTQASRVAHLLQTRQHGLTIGAVILGHPPPHLLFERVEFGAAIGSRMGQSDQLGVAQIFAHRISGDPQGDRNVLNRFALHGSFVYRVYVE